MNLYPLPPHDPGLAVDDPEQGSLLLWLQSKSHPHSFPLLLHLSRNCSPRVYLGNPERAFSNWVSVLLQVLRIPSCCMSYSNILYNALQKYSILLAITFLCGLFFFFKKHWSFLFSLSQLLPTHTPPPPLRWIPSEQWPGPKISTGWWQLQCWGSQHQTLFILFFKFTFIYLFLSKSLYSSGVQCPHQLKKRH